MSKKRVHELAKDLGLDSKDILAKIRQLKIPVKNHMSLIPEEDLDRLKLALADTDTTVVSGGVEEKRVTTEVIRRRNRPATAAVEEEKPKVDLLTLKQAVKRPRIDEEEDDLTKLPAPETLTDIPKEWTEEESEEDKKSEKPVRRRKAAAPQPEPPQPETVEPEPAPEPPDPAASDREPAAPQPEPEPVRQPEPEPTPVETPAAQAPAEPEPAAAEPEAEPPPPEKEKPLPVNRRMYIKPSIRKTARAVEGEPLPAPGRAPAPPAPEQADADKAAPSDDDGKKKKKSKKKKKGEETTPEETGMLGQEPPKRKLRRKIAFKLQRGVEGMELADIEQMYMPSKKKVTSKKKAPRKTAITTPKAAKRVVKMTETISVGDLARQLEVKSQEIVRTLSKDGIKAYDDFALDVDTAAIIASSYEYEIVQEIFDEDKVIGGPAPRPENLVARPPVVTVMGHVDHGKTSLLDIIRKTRVTEEEAGAITQHIGASAVETSSGKIVFVDTPGHEAFTTMRARGAKVTDIVVLVVAADDGIMPQTLEAAAHARAAKVPIIVAINKIDLPQANPQAVMQRLAELGLNPEQWGGETIVIECSAKTGQGVPELLESILLQAEILELTADPSAPAKCFVIESRLDKGRGPVATVVVQDGTLHLGDPVLCGNFYGKVRAMLDDRGAPVKEAGPSIPVEIMGLGGVPEPGEFLVVVSEEKKAKAVAEHRVDLLKQEASILAQPVKVSLEDLMARLEKGEVQSLNLIIKTDTHGSAEAIRASVEKLSLDEVKVAILHAGVGNITENDIILASASSGVILGFNVRIEAKSKKLAEDEGVQVRQYDIIYHLLDDVTASLKGLLKPTFVEKVIGTAEVRKVFRITKVGAIAGSYVTSGVIRRNAKARVLRAGKIVYTGKFKSLKRVQDDAREVLQGLECGIGLENYNDLQDGDTIEAFEVIETSAA